MDRGTSGKRQRDEVADRPGSQPWPISSWTPCGHPLSHTSLLPAVKLAWLRANHRRSEYTLQFVLVEQVAQLLRDDDIADGELEEAMPRSGTRDRARGHVVQVGVLAEERNVPGLAEVLDCDATADLAVGVGSHLHPHEPGRQDARRQIVRVAEHLHGAP